jgi:SAM-dependent methyltransferase
MTRLSDFVAGRSMSDLYDAYWVPSVLDNYAAALADRVSEGDRVLDLACGTGLVAGCAASRVGPEGEIVGYDPTPDLLDAARAKSFPGAPISWIEGFAEDMPFEDASFDIVLCHQGLQYVTDREQTFSEIKRVLKPDGMLHAGVWSSAADQPAFGFVEDAMAKHVGGWTLTRPTRESYGSSRILVSVSHDGLWALLGAPGFDTPPLEDGGGGGEASRSALVCRTTI